MDKRKKQFCTFLIFLCTILVTASSVMAQPFREKQQAKKILDTCDVRGGLIVHIGCGDGKLTAALRASDKYLVQGLDSSEKNVQQARRYIRSLGIYGDVSIDKLQGNRLPYIDNLVNLVVSEDLGDIDKRKNFG